MQSFFRESSLLYPVERYFRGRGYLQQQCEVQFYEYSMDIYGYSRRHGRSMAVELKLHRWKRAFEQALLYQLCADYAYLALPIEATTRVERALLERHGLGLIGVRPSSRCVVLLPAAESRVILPDYRQFYIRLMTEAKA